MQRFLIWSILVLIVQSAFSVTCPVDTFYSSKNNQCLNGCKGFYLEGEGLKPCPDGFYSDQVLIKRKEDCKKIPDNLICYTKAFLLSMGGSSGIQSCSLASFTSFQNTPVNIPGGCASIIDCHAISAQPDTYQNSEQKQFCQNVYCLGTYLSKGSLRPCPPYTYNDDKSKAATECKQIPMGMMCIASDRFARVYPDNRLCSSILVGCESVIPCRTKYYDTKLEDADISGVDTCGCCPAGYEAPPPINGVRGVRNVSECVLAVAKAGTFNAVENRGDLREPYASSDSPPGAASCRRYEHVCPKGTFSIIPGAMKADGGAKACRAAPPGSYVDFTGASSYTLCPKGKYNYAPPTTQSFTFPSEKYSWSPKYKDVGVYAFEVGATGPQDCVECPKGYYSPLAGSTSCSVIPKGAYAVDYSDLEWCPIGTYSLLEGATNAASCIPCDKGMTTVAIGSTSCTAMPKPDESSWVEYAFGGATAIIAFLYYTIHTMPHLLSWCRGTSRAMDSDGHGAQRGNYVNVATDDSMHTTTAMCSREFEMAEFEHTDAQVVVVDAVSIMNHDECSDPTLAKENSSPLSAEKVFQ